MEPFFIKQSTEPQTDMARLDWIMDRDLEAKREGAVWFRAAYQVLGNIVLFEAWKEKPEDMGPPRFSLKDVA